jgi:hypothetical protein
MSISDQGEGVPEENISKIFDPYFSIKERGGQKGMGIRGKGVKGTVKQLLEIDPQVKTIVAGGYSEDPVMQNYEA